MQIGQIYHESVYKDVLESKKQKMLEEKEAKQNQAYIDARISNEWELNPKTKEIGKAIQDDVQAILNDLVLNSEGMPESKIRQKLAQAKALSETYNKMFTTV